MITIDCLGEMCPIPVLKAQKEFKKLKSGDTIKIITDHSCALESVTNAFKKHQISADEVIVGVWEILITKS